MMKYVHFDVETDGFYGALSGKIAFASGRQRPDNAAGEKGLQSP